MSIKLMTNKNSSINIVLCCPGNPARLWTHAATQLSLSGFQHHLIFFFFFTSRLSYFDLIQHSDLIVSVFICTKDLGKIHTAAVKQHVRMNASSSNKEEAGNTCRACAIVAKCP